MEISTIKKSLKKFGLNFNNKIVRAILDMHKNESDSEGSGGVSPENESPIVMFNAEFPFIAIDEIKSQYEITPVVVKGQLTKDNMYNAIYMFREILDEDDHIESMIYLSTTTDIYYDETYCYVSFGITDGLNDRSIKCTTFTEFENIDEFLSKVNNKESILTILDYDDKSDNVYKDVVINIRHISNYSVNSIIVNENERSLRTYSEYARSPYNYRLSFIVAETTNNVSTDFYQIPVTKTYGRSTDNPITYNTKLTWYSEFQYNNKIYTIEWIDNVHESGVYHYWTLKLISVQNAS